MTIQYRWKTIQTGCQDSVKGDFVLITKPSLLYRLCFHAFNFSYYQHCKGGNCHDGSLKGKATTSLFIEHFFVCSLLVVVSYQNCWNSIALLAHSENLYYPPWWNNNSSHNQKSYLSQLIAPYQTHLKPKGYLRQIWRGKPGYQLL